MATKRAKSKRAPAKGNDAKPRRRVAKLADLAGVRSEMAKLYREARRGALPADQATKLVYILREIRQTIEAAEIEARLRDLEKRQGLRP